MPYRSIFSWALLVLVRFCFRCFTSTTTNRINWHNFITLHDLTVAFVRVIYRELIIKLHTIIELAFPQAITWSSPTRLTAILPQWSSAASNLYNAVITVKKSLTSHNNLIYVLALDRLTAASWLHVELGRCDDVTGAGGVSPHHVLGTWCMLRLRGWIRHG